MKLCAFSVPSVLKIINSLSYLRIAQKQTMKRFLLFSIIIPIAIGSQLLIINCFAQTTITGQIKNGSNQKVYLLLQKGSEPELLDSIVTDAKGDFKIQLKQGAKQGVYQLRLEMEKPAQLIIGNEKSISVSADVEEAKEGMIHPLNSRENDALAVLVNFLTQYNNQVDSLQELIDRVSKYDPQYQAKTDVLKRANEAAIVQFNNSVRVIPTLFSGTFTAEILCPLNLITERSEMEAGKIFDTDIAFQHVHFFDHVNFTDARIINTTVYELKLYTYLDTYTDHNEAGFKKAVDVIMAGAAKNTEVRDFTIAWMLEVFTKKGPPALVGYVNDTYAQGCDIPLKSETQKLLGKLKQVTIGTPAPELVINDINYTPQSMITTLKGKVGMLYFWASSCVHCMEHTPKVFEVYKKYKSKGFEVYSVSLDSDYAAWLKAIQDMKLEWINVSELKGWSAAVIETYALERTPSIILIDKNGNILDKNFSPEELEEKLKQYLQ